MSQRPSIGRVVHYKTTESDRKALKKKKNCNESRRLPAVIVSVWDDQTVNLSVLLDGEGTLWRPSVEKGSEEGQWDWPERI